MNPAPRTSAARNVPFFASILASLLLYATSRAEPQISPDEARPQVLWQDAGSVVGKVAYVSGKVVSVGKTERIWFINFDKARPPAFTAVIFSDNWGNFPTPPEEAYDGKIVRIRGIVSTYRDQPQIAVTSPDQIEVLDKLPEIPAKAESPEPPARDEITIATFNSLNLFDDVDDPYKADEGTPAKPRAELEALAAEILAVDADVIALEEVENRGYLERFVEVFLGDAGYQNVVLYEGNDLRGIDVCLLSRLPVGPVTSHRHLRFKDEAGRTRRFNRDAIAVTIEPPDAKPIEVWVVHLKSNSGGREYAEPNRLAEAHQLRALLDGRLNSNPDARFVVLGDFNDTWESDTLRTIVGSGPTALWSAASDSADPEVVTFNEEPFRSMIDFILCSPALAKQYVKGSYRVREGSQEKTGSDHNAVSARFRLK